MSAFQKRQSDDFDKILAKELGNLSIEEREDVYEAIHGVDQGVQETEELIQRSLEEMAKCISQIDDKEAYDQAIQASSSSKKYIESRQFRLLFLRSDNFRVQDAAIRLVNYTDRLLDHFGPQALGRPLWYSDLSVEAQKCFSSGVYQLWHNARDSAGRAIIALNYTHGKRMNISPNALVQTFMFLFWCAVINDEQTQKRGVVLLALRSDSQRAGNAINGNNDDGNTSNNYKVPGERNKTLKRKARLGPWAMVIDLQYCTPIKMPAIHICYITYENKAINRIWAPLTWALLTRDFRKRVRVHSGTHVEVMYALQSYGIPVDTIPIDFEGKPLTSAIEQYIIGLIVRQNAVNYVEPIESGGFDIREGDDPNTDTTTSNTNQQQEVPKQDATDAVATAAAAAANGTVIIDNPEKNDVALWRGRVYQLHDGNVQMRHLIDDHREEYDSSPRFGKAEIAMKIVSVVQKDYGGRFITKNSGGWWYEVDDEEAQKRVSKAFRSSRPKEARRQPKKTQTAIPTNEEYQYIQKAETNGKRIRMEASSPSLGDSCFGQNCVSFGKNVEGDEIFMDMS